MFQSVKIKNLSNSKTTIGDRVIPPLGVLYIPQSEYVNYAVNLNSKNKNIAVQSPPLELKRVNVKEFGAHGDGITDDTYYIQSAINFVESCGGGIVEIPIGVYLVRTLVVQKSVTFRGVSKLDSVLKSIDKQTSLIVFIGDSGMSAGLEKLRIV